MPNGFPKALCPSAFNPCNNSRSKTRALCMLDKYSAPRETSCPTRFRVNRDMHSPRYPVRGLHFTGLWKGVSLGSSLSSSLCPVLVWHLILHPGHSWSSVPFPGLLSSVHLVILEFRLFSLSRTGMS